MKALTFVGLRTGDGYRTARYSHEGRVVESNLSPIALYEFFRPERMIVFVTKESRQRYCFAPKIGGAKPRCFGSVQFNPVRLRLWGAIGEDCSRLR